MSADGPPRGASPLPGGAEVQAVHDAGGGHAGALAALRAMIDGRDPETLIGPLFFLFTRLAAAGDDDARCALADHLTVLAAHPAVDPHLRLAAGALAIEHRPGGAGGFAT